MKLQCKDGFISEYMQYTKYSESPAIFHRWVAISVIASVLGRNIYWDLGYSNIYPNLFVILVARSAGLKKTGAAEIGMDLLYNLPISIKIIADKLTNEYLLTVLGKMNDKEGKDAVAVVYAEELSVFIGPNALASGLIAALTKLYNCPSYFPYGTKTQGTYMLINCCLNILGASTPEWLRLCMPSESLGGGFTGRIHFVTAIDKERSIAHPKQLMPSRGDVLEQKRMLLDDLVSFSKLKGEFVMEKDAEIWYNDWYERREEEHNNDPRLESYYERRHTSMVKLAMVLAVDSGRDYIIKVEDLEKARKYLLEIEDHMISAYEGITYSDTTKHVDRLLRQIKIGGTISHSKLLQKNSFHMNAEEFDRNIKTLLGAETVEEIIQGKKRFYKLKGE